MNPNQNPKENPLPPGVLIPGVNAPAREGPEENVVHPTIMGTVLFCVALAVTSLHLEHESSKEVASAGAVGVGIAIVMSLLCDFQFGWRNVVRADVSAILALYFLTLFEFLTPQPEFDALVTAKGAQSAVEYCLWGFFGLAVGRHLSTGERERYLPMFVDPISPNVILWTYWGAFILGYLHMLVAVNFNVVEMVGYFMEPRFFQPWGRGRFGDWKALLNEVGMLLNLLPPLTGVMFARRERYKGFAFFLTCLGTLFTFFYGFSSGTRNIFCTYLVTFVIGYLFGVKKDREKSVLVVAAVAGFLLIFSTFHMLQFRQVGLRSYLSGEVDLSENKDKAFYVDMNLYTLAEVVQAFPGNHEFLGWEIPWLAIVRPIPRALWSGKPEGMSISMEQVVGADDAYTVAASFVGEAYMSGGLIGVLFASVLFGMMSGWWNRMGSPENNDLGVLIFASGFFASVISMRSLFVFTTAILPTLVAVFLGKWITHEIAEKIKHERLRELAEMKRRGQTPSIQRPDRGRRE